MLRKVREVLNEFILILQGMKQALFEKSVVAIEEEYIELNLAFLLILLGPLVGVKTLTPLLSLELLEHISPSEIKLLLSRSSRGEDIVADAIAAMGVD